jgi:hypothetical protein
VIARQPDEQRTRLDWTSLNEYIERARRESSAKADLDLSSEAELLEVLRRHGRPQIRMRHLESPFSRIRFEK